MKLTTQSFGNKNTYGTLEEFWLKMHKLRLGLIQICFNVPYHVNSSKIDESKNLTTNNITKIFFFIKKKKLNIDGIFKEQFSKKKKPDITSIRYDIKTYVITLLAQIHVLVTMQ